MFLKIFIDVHTDLPQTVADAKALNKATYFTGLPCKHGHLSARRADNTTCVECQRLRQKFNYDNNALYKQKRLATLKIWQSNNSDKVKQYKQTYVDNHREEIYAKLKAAWKKNPEKRKQVCTAYAQKHKAETTARTRARQAKKLKATPAWVNAKELEQIYLDAEYISRLTQVLHEVDHIVPLQHKFVSGLHVLVNLQILSTTENRRKSNFFKVC